MGRLTRRLSAVLLAAMAALAATGPAAALVLLWSLTASPLIATAGTATTFTLTATNLLLSDLGCLEVDLPASFAIVSVGTPSASNGRTWFSEVNGQAVVVYSDDGGGVLSPSESVTFTIRARSSTAGAYTWPNHAHDHQDCTGGDLLGTPIAVTVLPGATPTPAPTPLPTPLPTLVPTPLPTLVATPQPSLVPTPLPTLPPLPGGLGAPPSASAPPSPQPEAGSPSPDPSMAPSATSGPGASSGSGTTPAPDAGPPTAGGGFGSSGLDVATWSEGPAQLGISTGAAIGGIGAWLIPAAIVGGPGLAVIAWVALQLVGALAWVPAIRRLRREEPAAGR